MLLLLWLASRGYRSMPWRSPYLRWRLETYTGIPAESIDAALFFHLLWRERTSMLQYLLWVNRSQHFMKE
jgi:hypothetical protein